MKNYFSNWNNFPKIVKYSKSQNKSGLLHKLLYYFAQSIKKNNPNSWGYFDCHFHINLQTRVISLLRKTSRSHRKNMNVLHNASIL